MIVYHRTGHAEEILRDGFRDATGTNLTPEYHTGVWFSDMPVEIHEGAKGETVLMLDIPEDVLVLYEWPEEGKPFREFCCLAELVNRFGPPKIYSDDWQEFSEAELLRIVAEAEQGGFVQKAERLRKRIPFLKRHSLLAVENH